MQYTLADTDTTTDTITGITDTEKYPNHIDPNSVCNESLEEFLEDANFPTAVINPHSDFDPTIDLESKEVTTFSIAVDDEEAVKKETSELFRTAIKLMITEPTPPEREAKQAKAHDIAEADKPGFISSYVTKACHYAAVSLTNTAFTLFNSVKNNRAVSSYITQKAINPDYSGLRDIEDNTPNPNDLADSKTSYQSYQGRR